MKKSQYFLRSFLAINIVLLITLGVSAQGRRGGRSERGFGYSGSRFNAPRNFVSIGNNYRNYNSYRLDFGHNYNYYGSPYRSAYRSPFVYSHFGPAFGFRISILPFGYSPFFIGNNPFYYYQGVYYRPYNNGGYEVIAPPLNAVVKHLPSGAKVTVINGEKYYELGGTFYQEEISAKNKLQYRVVGTNGVINTVGEDENESTINDAPPVNNNLKPESEKFVQTQKLSQLPANCKSVIINNQKLYLAPNGIYYQESIDANNNLSYQSVGGEGDSK